VEMRRMLQVMGQGGPGTMKNGMSGLHRAAVAGGRRRKKKGGPWGLIKGR
jgi:hypothetical protein